MPMPQKIIASALGLGDQIQLWDHGYGTATVYRLNKDDSGKINTVSVWRPYIHTGDCEYSGPSVIPYVGIEDFEIYGMTDVLLIRSAPAPR